MSSGIAADARKQMHAVRADMDAPEGVIIRAIDHLDITPELRRNVQIEYYEAGHMMYVGPGSMGKFSEHIKTFIEENSA